MTEVNKSVFIEGALYCYVKLFVNAAIRVLLLCVLFQHVLGKRLAVEGNNLF
jgi:hypothetical protein